MRWQTLTKSNQAEFQPPAGDVLGVSYSPQDSFRDLALFFVAGNERPLWHAASVNGQPQNTEATKSLLKQVYKIFNVPCWSVFENTLLIWPPAINDGDILIVEIERADTNE